MLNIPPSKLHCIGNLADLSDSVGGEQVQSAATGGVFYFSSNRNAWWSTPSNTYPNEEAFCTTFLEAALRVEKRRVQGSAWWIEVLPALIFTTHNHNLVVTEINSDVPLQFSRKLPDDLTIGGLADYFSPSRPNSVMQFYSAKDNFWNVPLESYRSVSKGGTARLEWKKTEIYVEDVSAIDRLRKDFESRIRNS